MFLQRPCSLRSCSDLDYKFREGNDSFFHIPRFPGNRVIARFLLPDELDNILRFLRAATVDEIVLVGSRIRWKPKYSWPTCIGLFTLIIVIVRSEEERPREREEFLFLPTFRGNIPAVNNISAKKCSENVWQIRGTTKQIEDKQNSLEEVSELDQRYNLNRTLSNEIESQLDLRVSKIYSVIVYTISL